MEIEVTFLPQEAREYRAEVPLFLDGEPIDTSKPYLIFALMGSGLFPQLTFDTREVVLPVVPVGVTSRGSFSIINTGYDFLELRHRIPAESGPAQVSAVPLSPLALNSPARWVAVGMLLRAIWTCV